MKNLLLQFALILIVFLSLTSCSKDEPTPDYEKLLTAHTWVKGNIRAESDSKEALEFFDGYLMLHDDYKITFNEDGTYEVNGGKGTWELSADKKKIMFDQASWSKSYFPIHELKANSLKVSWISRFAGAEGAVYEANIYLDLVPQE
ncbi:hypothetical protein H8S95_12940 [Pontibacter sp. KCTC 32443]|uniref:hypothetical protein n=1 Tax=Pontibacter TaxID=323449 RepID=UPI00164DCA2F|nr:MULTISPECIES: hypothetical protein [Pontibacter]MBC5774975.1 hypothetical protein [Pontibacter sp. KCTC 32443]